MFTNVRNNQKRTSSLPMRRSDKERLLKERRLQRLQRLNKPNTKTTEDVLSLKIEINNLELSLKKIQKELTTKKNIYEKLMNTTNSDTIVSNSINDIVNKISAKESIPVNDTVDVDTENPPISDETKNSLLEEMHKEQIAKKKILDEVKLEEIETTEEGLLCVSNENAEAIELVIKDLSISPETEDSVVEVAAEDSVVEVAAEDSVVEVAAEDSVVEVDTEEVTKSKKSKKRKKKN